MNGQTPEDFSADKTYHTNLEAYITSIYDADPEREWQRFDRHRTEFAVTLRAIHEYFSTPPASILDCGAGPGRYAIELARRGYQVTLFDLSSENLLLADRRAEEAGVEFFASHLGNATDLSRFEDQTYDHVLLLGPLYHLLDRVDRLQAISEATRVLKPEGYLLAAFISRYAGHRYAAANEPEYILEQAEISERLLKTGILPPREEGNFVAYMAHPSEIEAPFWQAGLEVENVLGLEGLVSMIEQPVNSLSGELWEAWVDLNYQVASDTSIHGLVEHLLVVARKPRWRTVLSQIAIQLEQVGVSYKVVGGASVALHGVCESVKDLDLEMGIEDAYRFQELFSANTIQPVDWRESQFYRSHYGIFDFDGVKVDVMGDLERLQAGTWVSSYTKTLEQVEIHNVPIRVSWLEEETLAYIRRGRLNRATLCLPKCDRAKLLAILRGSQPQGVY